MFDKIKEALGLINEGTQDGLNLYKSFTTSGTDLATTFGKAFTAVKDALTTCVDFIGKVVGKFQA